MGLNPGPSSWIARYRKPIQTRPSSSPQLEMSPAHKKAHDVWRPPPPPPAYLAAAAGLLASPVISSRLRLTLSLLYPISSSLPLPLSELASLHPPPRLAGDAAGGRGLRPGGLPRPPAPAPAAPPVRTRVRLNPPSSSSSSWPRADYGVWWWIGSCRGWAEAGGVAAGRGRASLPRPRLSASLSIGAGGYGDGK